MQRIRQFMYNNTKQDTEKEAKSASNPYKGLSALTLFKQKYSKQIVDRRDELMAEEGPESSLRAYNQATRKLYAAFKVDAPGEHQELLDEVEQLKRASGAPYAAHAEHVQPRQVTDS